MEESDALKILYQYKMRLVNNPLFIDLKYEDDCLKLLVSLLDNKEANKFTLYIDSKDDTLYLSDHKEISMFFDDYNDEVSKSFYQSVAKRSALDFNDFEFFHEVNIDSIDQYINHFKECIGIILVESN